MYCYAGYSHANGPLWHSSSFLVSEQLVHTVLHLASERSMAAVQQGLLMLCPIPARHSNRNQTPLPLRGRLSAQCYKLYLLN